MKAYASTFFKLMKQCDTVFNIPVFQRNYDWGINECTRLFRDIESVSENGHHFLGSIVKSEASKDYDSYINIVDGQQRITSIMLLLRAIYDSTSDEKLRSRIRSSFLMCNDATRKSTRIKLKQIESDSAVYDRLIAADEFDENAFKEEEKKANIYINYCHFVKLIDKSPVSCTKLFDALNNLQIVDITLDDEDPQAVFESMNSTGKPLTNTDLIRNYLLMGLIYEEQRRLYELYWVPIEKNVGKEFMDDFMLCYLACVRKSDDYTVNGVKGKLNKKSLYNVFKYHYGEYHNDRSVSERILKNIYVYSMIYHRIYDAKPNGSPVEQAFYEIARQLSQPRALPFVLYLVNLFDNNKITEGQLLYALNAIISYLFRSSLLGHDASLQFFSLAIRQFGLRSDASDFETRIWQTLKSGNGRYRCPSDIEVKDAFMNKDMYTELKPAFVRYILYKFERYRSKEVVDETDATIEHIMPQNTSKWVDYLADLKDKEYESQVNKIGNLTLTKYNSELSNGTFDDKRRLYKESNYLLTRDVCRRLQWTSAEIKERSERMGGLACTVIWKVRGEIGNVYRSEAYSIHMNEDTCNVFDGLENAIHAIYPDLREDMRRDYTVYYYGNKALLSISPYRDHLIAIFNLPDDYVDVNEILFDSNGRYSTISGHHGLRLDEYSDISLCLNYLEDAKDASMVNTGSSSDNHVNDRRLDSYVGHKASHRSYGFGVVERVDEKKGYIDIRFSDGKERKFDERAIESGLLRIL